MTVQDILDVAGTADGNTSWGTDMRGAMSTLHTLATAFRVVPSTASTATAQAELTAAGTSGETVVFGPGEHSYGALSVPTRVTVTGCGLLTTITFTGGAATCFTLGNQSTLRDLKLLKGGTLRQAGSVGVDASDKDNTIVSNVRIEAFETAYKSVDTISTSFYSATYDLILWENVIGMDIGGTQANKNAHYEPRIRPIAGVAGAFGVRIVDARGLSFAGLNVEPGGTASGNGTGVSIDATSRACTFVSPWIENCNVGVTIAAGSVRHTFVGGTFTGCTTDWTNSGTNTVTINCETTGVRLHSVA